MKMIFHTSKNKPIGYTSYIEYYTVFMIIFEMLIIANEWILSFKSTYCNDYFFFFFCNQNLKKTSNKWKSLILLIFSTSAAIRLKKRFSYSHSSKCCIFNKKNKNWWTFTHRHYNCFIIISLVRRSCDS